MAATDHSLWLPFSQHTAPLWRPASASAVYRRRAESAALVCIRAKGIRENLSRTLSEHVAVRLCVYVYSCSRRRSNGSRSVTSPGRGLGPPLARPSPEPILTLGILAATRPVAISTNSCHRSQIERERERVRASERRK